MVNTVSFGNESSNLQQFQTETPRLIDRVGRVAFYVLAVLSVLWVFVRLAKWALCWVVSSLINGKIGLMSRGTKAMHAESLENLWNDPENKRWSKLKGHFDLEKPSVRTPEGQNIHTRLLRSNSNDPEIPVMIYFCGANQSADDQLMQFGWLFMQSIDTKKPCHFVFFDYRDLGELNQFFPIERQTPKERLTLDGATVVDWVHGTLGVPLERMMIYGFSIGGAISIEVLSKYQQTCKGSVRCIVSDRSFDSISEAMRESVGGGWYGRFVAWVLESEGYGTKISEIWNEVKKDKALVMYLERDTVIPENASLYSSLKKMGKDTGQSNEIILFKEKVDVKPRYRSYESHQTSWRQVRGMRELISNTILT